MRACLFEEGEPANHGSSTVRNAFAQQTGGPEYQHGDQHQERKNVLIVTAEKNHMSVPGTAFSQRIGNAGHVTQVHNLADVTRAERLYHAEQDAPEHRACKIADAAEHG